MAISCIKLPLDFIDSPQVATLAKMTDEAPALCLGRLLGIALMLIRRGPSVPPTAEDIDSAASWPRDRPAYASYLMRIGWARLHTKQPDCIVPMLPLWLQGFNEGSAGGRACAEARKARKEPQFPKTRRSAPLDINGNRCKEQL